MGTYLLYVLFAIAFLFVLILIISRSIRKSRNKVLEKLQEGWGRPKTGYFSFDEIGLYAEQNKEASFHQLTKQTKVDIDFDDLFAFIDRTTSCVGQQYLYDSLQKPVKDIEALKNLTKKADFFRNHKAIREEVQYHLSYLGDSNSYYIAGLLSDKLIERPKWFRFLMIDTIIVIVMLLLSTQKPVLLIWMMIPFAVNLGFHFWNKNNTYRFFRSLPQLDNLINTAQKISALFIPFNKESVVASIANLKTFQRKMQFISFGQQGVAAELAQLYYYFTEVFKALFLIELHVFYRAIRELEQKQDSIHTIFKYVGDIDTCISVGSVRSGLLPVCDPVFITERKMMRAIKIYHPLIEDYVTNDLTINTKSVLITGSNMSGKTTFLRTIAINSVLAQTIGTCFAESFAVPVLKLSSSIRIDDSIEEGKSYYLEEVDVMNKLIQEVRWDQQNLFILDEVFKGTNTLERIAAGKAILSYLNRFDNIVLVSTHDIELSEMLALEYELYHFVETIQDDQLYFDHILKPGQLKTRNAIKILEMSDYPAEIINEAKAISSRLLMVNNKNGELS